MMLKTPMTSHKIMVKLVVLIAFCLLLFVGCKKQPSEVYISESEPYSSQDTVSDLSEINSMKPQKNEQNSSDLNYNVNGSNISSHNTGTEDYADDMYGSHNSSDTTKPNVSSQDIGSSSASHPSSKAQSSSSTESNTIQENSTSTSSKVYEREDGWNSWVPF